MMRLCVSEEKHFTADDRRPLGTHVIGRTKAVLSGTTSKKKECFSKRW
jgi:hypothetical protein